MNLNYFTELFNDLEFSELDLEIGQSFIETTPYLFPSPFDCSQEVMVEDME